MKLIIQIPCYNEAETLPAVLAELPASIPGVDCIQTLVIDDGSDDGTAEIAGKLGVTHILRQPGNKGLAAAFQAGVSYALNQGADIIVNTDGDNQYPGKYIADLVAPIVNGEADMTLGDRQVSVNPFFSPFKRQLQKLGSWVVRTVSGVEAPDAASGFRAYSQETALRLNVLSHYSYTLETLIQAGKLGLRIVSFPIDTHAPTRPSRLQRNMWHFIKSQAGTILRVYAFYEPLRTFSYVAAPFLAAGIFLLLRFLFAFLLRPEQWNSTRLIQSITIGTGLLLVGILIGLFGVLADIAGKHRRLTEEMLYRLRKSELEKRSIHS